MAEYRQLVSGLVRTLQRRKRSLIGRTRDWAPALSSAAPSLAPLAPPEEEEVRPEDHTQYHAAKAAMNELFNAKRCILHENLETNGC